MVVVVIM